MEQTINSSNLTSLIKALFEESTVKSLTPILNRGVSSTKYHCILQDGKQFLVRVNEKIGPKFGLARYKKAEFCSKVCAELNMKIPVVSETGLLPNGLPYSIEEWIDGAVPADTIRDPDKRLIIWHNLGKEAFKLLFADLKGKQNDFYLGYDGDSPTEVWEQHCLKIIDIINKDSILGLTKPQKAKFIDLLTEFDLITYPPGLCHGDLKLDNILIDPDSLDIMGILDWELARYAPSVVGELSTSLEPAILEVKKYAVPISAKERNVFIGSFSADIEKLTHDFIVFYSSDILMNLGWYADTIEAGIRPDIDTLKIRLSNYLSGLGADIEILKGML